MRSPDVRKFPDNLDALAAVSLKQLVEDSRASGPEPTGQQQRQHQRPEASAPAPAATGISGRWGAAPVALNPDRLLSHKQDGTKSVVALQRQPSDRFAPVIKAVRFRGRSSSAAEE